MARLDEEFPVREEYPLVPEEFPQPLPETEYRLPDSRAEDSAPPGTDHANPDPALEFTPPGSGRAEAAAPAGRKRRIRRLLYGAAALVLLGLLFGGRRASFSPALPAPTIRPAPSAPAPTQQLTPAPSAEPTMSSAPEPTTEPTPEIVSKVPVIEPCFYAFSHEHHGRILMSNTGSLHSVYVAVRETSLDELVWERYLEEDEIASGRFDLPELSTGDFYMDHMEELEAAGGWPEYEMTVRAWYENEAGDGEDTLEYTLPAEFELGIGVSYWGPDYTWDEELPPDSFIIKPWEEIEDVTYVINDPDAVTDPTVFSVDILYNGRHAAPEEYEIVLDKDEYSILDSETGEYTPTVGITKTLILRRPDWLPERGTIHVTIVQRIATTNELRTLDYDLDYPPVYDW